MIPVIAIVGRPNVGKSTLFNCLTQTRNALVADEPGVTRDRLYGEGQNGEQRYIVIDTGGLGSDQEGIAKLTTSQTWQAIKEANVILFLLDGRSGLTAADRDIASQLRNLPKKVYLVVNKTDGVDINTAIADFYELGLGEPIPISAAHRRGITALLDKILTAIPVSASKQIPEGIKIAFVGRPNVGKSTLVNRILGEERVIVYDQPGTTRDSIFIPFKRAVQNYVLIDTAGVRRRGKVTAAVEKFSVIKSLQAIEQAHVAVIVIDAHEGLADQDLHLLDFVISAGKALVVAINKWDAMEKYKQEQLEKTLDRKLVFVDFARIHFISALRGTGINNLFKSINEAYKSAIKKLATPQLTRALEKAVEAHQPPLVRGRRIKLRFAHAAGNNPPFIIIHGNQVTALPESYRTYLEKTFRKKFGLIGTPIKIEFKNSANPYR